MIVGIVVSVASLWVLLSGVEWDRFWSALQGADYWWLLPAVLALGAAMWIKVLKWELLVRPAGKTRRLHLFYSMTIGYLVNDVLPGRLGEIARVYSEARLDRISPAAVLASVAVDRILDVVAVALLLAVALPTADLPAWVVESGLMVGAGGLALLIFSIAMAYPMGRGLFLRVLGAAPAFPGKALIEKWAESLFVGLEGLRGATSLFSVIVTTLAIWVVTALSYYFTQRAFHIDAPIWAAVLALCLTNLGMVVPSSPGYIGVFHYLVVVAMGAFGVEKELALGYAIVMHLIGFLPVGIVGAFSLWRCGLTLTDWKGSGGGASKAGAPASR